MFISKLNWYRYKGDITENHINKMIKQNENRWKIKYLHEILGESNNYDFIISYENYEDDYYKMIDSLNLKLDIFIKEMTEMNTKVLI